MARTDRQRWYEATSAAIMALTGRVDQLFERQPEPAGARQTRLAITVRDPNDNLYPEIEVCPNTYWIVFVDGSFSPLDDGLRTHALLPLHKLDEARTLAKNIWDGEEAYCPLYTLIQVSCHLRGYQNRPQWWFHHYNITPCVSSSSGSGVSSAPPSSAPASSAPASSAPASSAPTSSAPASSAPASSAPASSGPAASSAPSTPATRAFDVLVRDPAPYNECTENIVVYPMRIWLPYDMQYELLDAIRIPLNICQSSAPASSGPPASSAPASSAPASSAPTSSGASSGSGSGSSGSGTDRFVTSLSDPISPDAEGTYNLAGTHGGEDYWEREDSAYFIWWNTGNDTWYISDTLGGAIGGGDAYWYRQVGEIGTYMDGGTASNPAVVGA